MRVPAEVFDGIAETAKCFFYVRTPVLCIKAAAEFRPVEGIAQFSAGGGKAEAPILIEFLEPCEEFSFKLIPQHFDRDEKVTPCRAYVTAGGKAAAGNNTMHMHVVAKLLVPGMQDLDDTGCCAEVFLIRREFQERISAAFMEKPIKELLVAVKQGVQLVGECEHHMEIRCVNDLFSAFVHPDFLIERLAVRTAAVAAGIIVELDMSAIRAFGNIHAEPAGFTVEDGPGSFPLSIGLKGAGCAVVLIRIVPDLLYFQLSHGRCLPSGQKG